MTKAEQKERERLHRLWATRRISMKQMKRCMVLDRKAQAEARAEQSQ